MSDHITPWEPCLGHQDFQSIGMVARWRPVHLGQIPVLRAMCTCARHALIGIGSVNRYNARNPFTVGETEDMLRLALDGFDNYAFIHVPDLDDGPRWRLMILEMLGDLDLYLTANPYVANLLHRDYNVIHPVALVAPQDRVRIEGSMVRLRMAQNMDWESLVPPDIAAYIHAHHLDERFRNEFGLETIAMESIKY